MIKIKNLTKIYGKGEAAVKALDNVSLEIFDNEFVAITGKSGSGKTTLLNLLGGLDAPDSGEIFYDDRDITKLNDDKLSEFRLHEIGFVFQAYDLIPELTARENILLPARLSGNKKAENFRSVCEKLGLSDRLSHYPSQLSGGQQQRAAIARSLINDPKILLCDEPTGNLDSKSGEEVLNLLISLKNELGVTIIIVTHDEKIAARADRIVRIEDGKISE